MAELADSMNNNIEAVMANGSQIGLFVIWCHQCGNGFKKCKDD
ncbi:hypothetical protein [Shewanella abyssi]|nr:hypothetical protein [Shewanella abyssi]